MLPKTGEIQDFTEAKRQTSRTYQLNVEKNRIYGYVDELEAVQQAVYKILSTQRYEHLIYSWNYGTELFDLFGKPVNFAASELQRRITEALMQDDRITSVDAFSFDIKRNKIFVEFTVHSIFGDIEGNKEVAV